MGNELDELKAKVAIMDEPTVRAELQKRYQLRRDIEARVSKHKNLAKTMPDPHTNESHILDYEYILSIINALAKRIIHDYAGKHVLLIGLMDGGTWFAERLKQAIKEENKRIAENKDLDSKTLFAIDYCTMRTASYSGIERGELKIDAPKTSVADKTVLCLDDIYDSGSTGEKVKEYLRSIGAADVKIAVLFNVCREDRDTMPDYACVDVPGKSFYVGCGMNYLTDGFRELDDLYTLDLDYLATKEEKVLLATEAFLIERLNNLEKLKCLHAPVQLDSNAPSFKESSTQTIESEFQERLANYASGSLGLFATNTDPHNVSPPVATDSATNNVSLPADAVGYSYYTTVSTPK